MSEKPSPELNEADPTGEDRRDPDEAPMRSGREPLPGDDPPAEPIHES